jgi:hypothetical protein
MPAIAAVRGYFTELGGTAGAAWNRFWFTSRDARWLGILRVLVGLMAFYTIATYGPDLDRWFGAGGMLPLGMVRGRIVNDEWVPGFYDAHWSLLDVIPPRLLWPAFWASLAAIGLFTLGIGGRIAAVAATVATLSFFSRAPMVTGEFEPILALLMVYLCVGRASDEYSVPVYLARRARGRAGSLPQASNIQHPASPLNTTALRLLQIHIAIVHLMMACAMLAAPEGSWWTGEGIYLAAMRPGMALVDFTFLKEHPRIVAAWSHAITLYLLTFPVLVWPSLSRPIVLAIGALIWLSIALATGWLMFSLAMLLGLLAFVDLQGDARQSSQVR